MKLHLPLGLRRALLACLAAVTLPFSLPTTVGTASGLVAAYAAASCLFVGSAARAEFTGPQKDGSPLEYTPTEDPSQLSGNVSYNLPEQKPEQGWPSFGSGGADVNLKLETRGSQLGYELSTGEGDSDVTLESLWVEGNADGNSRVKIGSHVKAGDIYSGGAAGQRAQLWMSDYENGNFNLHIGASAYDAEGYPAFHHSALRIDGTVTTSGYLDVVEDAKISMDVAPEGGATLTVGKLTGAGNLQLAAYGGNTGTLRITEGGEEYTGVIELSDHIVVELAGDAGTAKQSVGGFAGSAGAVRGTGTFKIVGSGAGNIFGGTLGLNDNDGEFTDGEGWGTHTSTLSLEVAATGAQTLNGGVHLNDLTVAQDGSLVFGSGAQAEIDGNLSGGGDITVNGTLILAGGADFSGTVTVGSTGDRAAEGKLQIGLGSGGTYSFGILELNNGTLTLKDDLNVTGHLTALEGTSITGEGTGGEEPTLHIGSGSDTDGTPWNNSDVHNVEATITDVNIVIDNKCMGQGRIVFSGNITGGSVKIQNHGVVEITAETVGAEDNRTDLIVNRESDGTPKMTIHSTTIWGDVSMECQGGTPEMSFDGNNLALHGKVSMSGCGTMKFLGQGQNVEEGLDMQAGNLQIGEGSSPADLTIGGEISVTGGSIKGQGAETTTLTLNPDADTPGSIEATIDNITLVKTGAGELTLLGNVGAAGAVASEVREGTLYLGDESHNNTVTTSSFIVGTEDGSTNATVEVRSTGAKNTGGVTVYEGSNFIIKTTEGWTGEDFNNTVSGGGTVTLSGLTDAQTDDWYNALFGQDGSDVGELVLTDNTSITADTVGHIGGIRVDAGSVYTVNGGEGLDIPDVTGEGQFVIASGKVNLSGTDDVAQIELKAGATANIAGENALGGSGTTLTLSGGTITAAEEAQVQAGKVTVNGDTVIDGMITLTGTLTGNGTLTAGDGMTAGLSGDISGYTGKLDTGTSGTWTLSDAALGDIRIGEVSGDGTVEFAGDASFGGKVSGGVTLRESGTGNLVITSTDTSTDAKLDGGSGRITLGGAEGDTQAAWNGTELVGGDIYLADVKLAEGGFKTKNEGVGLYVDTFVSADGMQGGTVNVNGMDAAQLDGITINEHGQLTGITGTYTADASHRLELHFASDNFGTESSGGKALIQGKDGFTLSVGDKTDLDIYLDSIVSEIISKLAEAEEGATEDVYLYLVENGTISLSDGMDLTVDDMKGEGVADLLRQFVQSIEVDGGNLKITGSAKDVFVTQDSQTLDDESAEALGAAKATVLGDAGDELTLSLDGEQHTDGDVVVHNLLGVYGSRLTLENSNADGSTDGKRLTVTFDNTRMDDIQEDGQYPTVDGTDVHGQHTTFNGSITGGTGVDVEKEGKGTLTVGGDYTLEDGKTTIKEGALRLRGADNRMETLDFAYEEEQDTANGEDRRGLLLEGGDTVIGSITETGTETGGMDVLLSKGADLTLTGESELEHTAVIGDEENGGGRLTLAGEDAHLTLSGTEATKDEQGNITDAQLSGVDVDVEDGACLEVGDGAGMDVGSVTLSGTADSDSEQEGKGSTLDVGSGDCNRVGSLMGDEKSTLKSSEGGNLTVGGGTFSGTLAASDDGTAGQLTVEEGADFTLDNVITGDDPETAWDIEVGDGGSLTVDVSEKDADESVTFGDVNLGSGSTATFRVNGDTYNAGEDGKGTINGGSLSWGEDTHVVLDADAGDMSGYADNPDKKFTLGNFDETQGDIDDLDVQLHGDAFLFSDVKDVEKDEDGNLTVELEEAKSNKFKRALPQGEKNAMAGADLFWESLREKTKSESLIGVLTKEDSDYARMVHGLVSMMDSGDAAGLQKALAAGAGAGITVLGPALAEDMHRQLTSVRNRTTCMGEEVPYSAYDPWPYFHAWIHAETGYHKLDGDGLAPGFTLSNWGGTIGLDADLSAHTSTGAALTAMYGDLRTDSADAAKGDLDTMYLSLFWRRHKGAWSHTAVLSGGLADVSLRRTVQYTDGSYRTNGDTNGYALGALYEVGYAHLLRKDGSSVIQPVANIELRHISLSGYSETGSDAGLRTGDIRYTVLTVGGGARFRSVVGRNAFNRSAFFEGRGLLKVDVGDTRGSADNAILGSALTRELESAEIGRFGVELGAGITIPLGPTEGSVFLDGSVELRRGYTNFNATLGYRINF